MRSGKSTYGLAMLMAAAMLAGCAAGGGGAGNQAGGGTEASGAARAGDEAEASGGDQPGGEEASGGSGRESSRGSETAPYLWDVHTTQELMAADYLMYRVNCGAAEDTGGETGLYQTADDQPYGADAGTGKQWGYRPAGYMEAVEDDTGEDLTRYRWEIAEGAEYDPEQTGFYYDFEVPGGTYEVTLGFYNPFSARTVTAVAEDQTVMEDQKILKYKLTENAFYTTVTDGSLQLKVYNPDRGKDAMKDPVLSYILVRAVPEYTADLLKQLLEQTEIPENVIPDRQTMRYTAGSYEAFSEQYQAAEALAQKEDAPEEEYRKQYMALKDAYDGLEEIKVYDSFLPGKKWTDDEGNLIQAHGGQVQRLTVTDPATGQTSEKWWWVGEDKTNGSSRSGICAYSSDDLYNWHYEGIVMRNVESRAQLDEEEYFTSLYADYTPQQKDNVFACLDAGSAIIERPKLIFNEKTGMYVLWFHADGPTETSNSSYAAACAGVAVSDTPYGPFKFIDRYRLNTCPPDQEDFHPQSKGMARDMNLFVDEDGTAYIIYSSEENLTLYISKLNDEYTYLAVSPEQAVYGRDYIRLFPGAQREAPALFARDGGYYLMTSGCTGWAPNQARYYRADSVLGEWENCGDPCVGDDNHTTFESQSTCIFRVGDAFIYMGDRWNSEDLKNSRYIWLPVAFDEAGNMSISYTDEWKLP